MAIAFVGAASGASTATLPAHQAGDLILVFAYRDASAVAPTAPAGFTSINTSAANTQGHTLAYRIAQSSGESLGTWANATSVLAQVYRGAHPTAPIGGNTSLTGTGTTIDYPAITLSDAGGGSWVAGFAGIRITNRNPEDPPAGMVNRSSFTAGTTSEVGGHDTNGGVTAWPLKTGGASGGFRWRSAIVEMVAAPAGGGAVSLDAAPISADAPTVGAPSLAQRHGLAAVALGAAAAALTLAQVAQVHQLAGSPITGSVAVPAAPAAQRHGLTAGALSAAPPALALPGLAQRHTLAAADLIAGTPTFTAPAVAQTHPLAAGSLSASPAAPGAPALSQRHALSADALSGGGVLAAAAFGQAHRLAASDIVGSAVVGAASTGQAPSLTPVPLAPPAPDLSRPALAQRHAATATPILITPVLGRPSPAPAGPSLPPPHWRIRAALAEQRIAAVPDRSPRLALAWREDRAVHALPDERVAFVLADRRLALMEN